MNSITDKTGEYVDRQSMLRKDSAILDIKLKSELTQIIVWNRGKFLSSGTQILFDYQEIVELLDNVEFELIPSKFVFLGDLFDQSYFLLLIDYNSFDDETISFVDLRKILADIDTQKISIFLQAQGLAFWHQNHQFCASCGSNTSIDSAGHSRICNNAECSKRHFPKLDPAVIFLIINQSDKKPERILLARQASWEAGRYSVIAGFVEHGENLEQAVIREAQEEVGILIDSVNYFRSQAWPFPASLMVAFNATTQNHELTFHDGEIETAIWLNAMELSEAVSAGKVLLPNPYSISFGLIETWYQNQTGKPLLSR